MIEQNLSSEFFKYIMESLEQNFHHLKYDNGKLVLSKLNCDKTFTFIPETRPYINVECVKRELMKPGQVKLLSETILFSEETFDKIVEYYNKKKQEFEETDRGYQLSRLCDLLNKF